MRTADSINQHLARLAMVWSVAFAVGLLGTKPVAAADPAARIAKIGFVGPESPDTRRGLSAFWKRLPELGWVEGQNLIVERRWAEGHLDRLPRLMSEMLDRHVEVLVTYSTPGGAAAKKATSTVPIVVATMGDPVGTGLAQSLVHPGGNLTGLSLAQAEGIGGKWLELLHELVPTASTIAVIGNPDSLFVRNLFKQLQEAALGRHLKLRVIEVRKPEAIDAAFARARDAHAVVIPADPLLLINRARLTSLAAKYRLPAIYGVLEFTDSGGLMAYGPDASIMFRGAADFVDRILRGARPGELPIEQPTEFKLIVNLTVAKALGITIPESILLRANEVIR